METSVERRKVAASMRAVAGGPEVATLSFGEMMNSVLTGGAPRPTYYREMFRRLADLIDPTCEVVGTATSWPLHGPQIFIYELSCGHTCYTDWPEPPEYCDQCGARVVTGDD